MKCRTFLQRAGQGAGQRDLKPIQNPGDAERQHNAGMETAPAQAVEASGNTGFNDATIAPSRRRCHVSARFNAELRCGRISMMRSDQ